MPASTLDPVSAALRNALSHNSSEDFLSSQLSGSSRRILNSNIDFERTETYQSTVLNSLKSKYIVLQSNNKTASSSKKAEMGTDEALALPQKVLFPLEAVQLGWSNSEWSIGAGMINMGNTCYLNSTLQALFHVPALVNWLMSDKQHSAQCEDSGGGQSGGCIICAMGKTLQASQQRNTPAIRPWLVYSKLRLICRHFVPGRQEDAHEFLRYLVEAMERAYIQRFRNLAPLDIRSKETTPLNQILGGYLRSAVRCLECGHVSTTFQHFQDVLLDIRKVSTLDDALDLYFSREKLDDLAYHCENCQKKVMATKQFSLERAPMVLCLQLKRFSVSNNKITKHIAFRQRLELTRFARRKPSVPLVYRLVSLVTHVGQTVSCGHYTAVAQGPSGNFYQFDDSMVRPISQQSVFSTNAYIMLYELECSPSTSLTKSPAANKNSKTVENDTTAHSMKESIELPLNNTVSTLPHVNGLNLPKNNSNLIATHNNSSVSQNGNGRCTNGVEKHSDSSDSDDSEPNSTRKLQPQKINNKPVNGTSSKLVLSPSKSSSFNSTLISSPIKTNTKDANSIPSDNQQKHQLQSILKKDTTTTIERKPFKQFQENSVSSSSQTITKLVPYEVDDSNSSNSTDDSPSTLEHNTLRSQIVTKAGAWKVSPANTFHGPSLEGQTGWNRKQREAVAELLHMSHEGYSAPVSTWNGTRAALDRQVNNERREDRKRTMADNNPDKPKIKQPKHNNYVAVKTNPGYNPFQEYSSFRKWQQTDSHYYKKSHYNNGMRHRYQQQRRNGHHNNNNRHRDKFRR